MSISIESKLTVFRRSFVCWLNFVAVRNSPVYGSNLKSLKILIIVLTNFIFTENKSYIIVLLLK